MKEGRKSKQNGMDRAIPLFWRRRKREFFPLKKFLFFFDLAVDILNNIMYNIRRIIYNGA